jgi:hypothetical protein
MRSMKEKSAPESRFVEDAVDLYLAREQAEALKSYLDRGRKLCQLSEQALAEKHFEVIKAWAKHLHGGSDVADVYAEYELRGLEPLALENIPAWSVILAAIDKAVKALSEKHITQIGREVFDAARRVEEEIN